MILKTTKREEANIDELVKGLLPIHGEFSVDTSVLQAHQHLIQFVTNLALHVLASVPEYKHRPGPGVSHFMLIFMFPFFFWLCASQQVEGRLKRKSVSDKKTNTAWKGTPIYVGPRSA